MDILPIIGMGSPSFRGGINSPRLVDFEVRHYQGYKTVTIQSAVRYDVPYSEYRKVSSAILQWSGKPVKNAEAKVIDLVRRASESYKRTMARYMDSLIKYSSFIQSTRDRIEWREYGRTFSLKDRLLSVPRAIVYTATWYTLGLPPTFLDAKFVIESYKSDEIDEILNYMPYLIEEWKYEAQFYVPSVAAKRLDETVVKKINEALDCMAIKPEPIESYRKILELNPVEPHVIALAKIRGFLG